MGTLLLKQIDDRVIAALQSRAKANDRTVEAEVEELLSRAVEPVSARAELWSEVRRIAAMTPKGVEQADSVLLLREDRNRS
jgi:plasmid stability protein